MIIKAHRVVVYETADERQFNTQIEAQMHQAELMLTSFLENSDICERSGCFADIAKLLVEEHNEIKDILSFQVEVRYYYDSNNN